MSKADKRPREAKPVQKIELSEKNTTLRTVIAVLCLAIGIGAVMFGLMSALNTDPGWKTVEVSSSSGALNCSSDFVFSYFLGQSGVSATTEYKQLVSVYTKATEDAYRIFHESLLQDGVSNLCYLSHHVNETVRVNAALYQALELVKTHGNRSLYLAPVYMEYNRIFRSESEPEAAGFDPAQNPDLLEYIRQVCAFANDPEAIDVELLGNSQVRLKLSEAYLAFAREYEITEFLDFGWMKNAFIADYLAQILTERGFTRGYLASYDGFTRNLDQRGESYSFNLFDRLGNDIFRPATISYDRPISIVYLRNYPLSSQDRWHYYGFTGGRIVTLAIDPADGLCKSSTDNMVAYSGSHGCAEILLRLIPVYVADELQQEGIQDLMQEEIFSIWFEATKLLYNDPQLKLTLDTVQYSQYSSALVGNE